MNDKAVTYEKFKLNYFKKHDFIYLLTPDKLNKYMTSLSLDNGDGIQNLFFSELESHHLTARLSCPEIRVSDSSLKHLSTGDAEGAGSSSSQVWIRPSPSTPAPGSPFLHGDTDRSG